MINNLKDLNKLLTLCRRHGVTSIKLGAVEVTIGDNALKKQKTRPASMELPSMFDPGPVPYPLTPDDFETDGLTDEQLLYYSARPEPGTEGQ